jgi:hypothetical protein
LREFPAKPALGQQNGPRTFVSGREKACLADHARGVNWPLLEGRAAVGGFAIALRQTQKHVAAPYATRGWQPT